MRTLRPFFAAIAGLCACSGCLCLGLDFDEGSSGGSLQVDPPYGGTGGSGSTSGGVNGGGSASGGSASGGSASGGSASGGSACGCQQSADAGPSGPNFTNVPVGSPCQSDADCGVNGTCQPPLDLSNGASPTQWIGGYCTGVGCTATSQCPSGTECFLYPGTKIGLCLADCGTPTCQRPGYTCSDVGDPVQACLPECHQDADCGPNLVCDSGSCAPPCAAATDCAAGELCSNGHCQAGPPQTCSATCACPGYQICLGGECVAPCSYDADCPAGERCSSTDVCE